MEGDNDKNDEERERNSEGDWSKERRETVEVRRTGNKRRKRKCGIKKIIIV